MGDNLILNPFATITFAEIVDILLVATVLYTAIVWAQHTRAAFVVRGMVILGAIYLIARYLDLQMSAWIFQAFFAAFLIMIVVIFQEELRHMFERIAVWSLTGKRLPALRSTTVDILVRTVADLAKRHIGALIVIVGNDPIERHITGGIQLEGRLSGQLLQSIFDTHSPGHDGAILIEKGRVTRFAAHLPLSKDLQQLAQVGTRHSAGLGLAELTDALCIIVSEERGTISVARDGQLRKMEDVEGFRTTLQNFLQETFPPANSGQFSMQFFRENWVAKAVSLSLAIGFWYIFGPGSKTIELTYRIPVFVENLSANLVLEEIQPEEIAVTFAGPRRAFYLFDSRNLRATVDVSLADLGRRTFSLTDQNIQHPRDIVLEDITPNAVKISVKASAKDTLLPQKRSPAAG